MKISRIEIFGFKSFLERVVLPVDQGITAIVGPNGCGKSNIVDALRWVFGETRASQLRGALLEDVIFNGTETLRPLGLAEVSLVISTDKACLYDDIVSQKRMAEAAVKESIDRENAESEQSKDLEDSSLSQEVQSENQNSGRPKLVVIEGALSNKTIAEDSQNELSQATDSEEVAQETSKASEEELGAAAEDKSAVNSQFEEDPALARFSWLKLSREVEVTRRLYRSGESEFFINKVACRLRDLKDLFRLLGLGARSYTLVAQGEVSRIITSKPEERRLMIEEAAGVSGVRERLSAAEKRLEDTKLSLTRLNDLLVEVTRQVNSLRVQATRARNRAEIKERLKFLDLSVIGDKLRGYTERTSLVETQLNQLREQEVISKEQLENLLQTEESIQRELVEYNSRRETLSQQIKRGRAALAARQAQKSALESESLAIEQQLKSKLAQFEELNQRIEVAGEQLENASQELEHFNETIEVLQSRMGTLEKNSSEELQSAISRLESARAANAQAQVAYQESRSQVQALKARLESLDEQLSINANNISSDEANPQVKAALESLRPILGQIHASEDYRKALEVAISNCADLHVCEDFPGFISNLIQSGEIKNASKSLKVMALPKNVTSIDGAELSVPKLTSVLEISEGYKELFDSLLGHVYLCESLEEAYRISSQTASDSKLAFVTKSGELLSSNSFALYREALSPVEQFAKRRALAQELELAQQSLDECSAQKEEFQSQLSECENLHNEALSRSVESEQEIRKITSDLGAMRGKAEVISRVVSQLTEERSSLLNSISGWETEKLALLSRQQEINSMLNISLDGEDMPIDQETLDQLEEELEEINCRGKEVIDSLEERSRARDQARSEYEELTALRSKAEFEFEKICIERQASESRLHDLYPEISAESILNQEPLSSEDQHIYSEEAEKLRTRIQREGEVDPSSIEMFEQEEIRLNELKTQKADLEAAEKTLAETVTQLSELARKRFLDTFKIVQANFARLIPRVFGGGYGALHLENTDDPFEGGIEVSVRPPGKKPKSIELLSGGERALCAIAMIFSMFLHKPSPLCVLDEVDAPLDEANLRRYLMMVREMSSVTQFLMISHNKEAMAAADRLVGVTQEQPGASQVVTVSLEQAQAQVA